MRRIDQTRNGVTHRVVDSPQLTLTPTAGKVLPNGTVIDLVRASGESKSLNLIVRTGSETVVAPSYEHEGLKYVPASADSSILRAMRFPTGVCSFRSSRELFDDVANLLSHHHDLPEESIALAAYFVFATWLPERTSLAPLLSIVASPTAPSEALMGSFAILCRRPMRISDPDPADILALPMNLQPTLLVDSPRPSARLQGLLCASRQPRNFFTKRGRAIDLFGPKVICSRRPLIDESLMGAMIEIALSPTNRQLPLMDWIEFEVQATKFQCRFLSYRLAALQNVCESRIDCGDLINPLQALAQSLASCIVGDDALQGMLLPLLRRQDSEMRVDLSLTLESIVLEALLACCHDERKSALMVLDLTQCVNTILAARGENRQTSPEEIGWKLRALGLHTDPIGRKGKGLQLFDPIRKRIHELARIYCVRSVQGSAVPRCRHCLALVPRTTKEGSKE